MNEQHYEEEFDRLYAEGKVGEGVLDDDLPDFKDDWIAERMEEESKPTMNQQKLREWILKQDYFSLNPKFDGMTAWELAGIIIREGQSVEEK